MNKKIEDAIAFGISSILVSIALFICFWTAGMVFGAIGNWLGELAKSEQPTQQDIKEAEEWKKDPLNPDNQARKCLKEGGYPEYHYWKGGDVTCEKSKAKE